MVTTQIFMKLRVLGDGSSWLMSYDPQYIDMSKIVPGGNVHTLVTGLIVQHINAQKNVNFSVAKLGSFSDYRCNS